jgi:hypothetical protein
MERQLVLVREAKIASLLAGAEDRRLEASGVLAADDCFFVVFDNAPDIGRLGAELRRAEQLARLPGRRAEQGPRGADLRPPGGPGLPARPLRGEPVQGRPGRAAAGGR